jgi:hypothetical protein
MVESVTYCCIYICSFKQNEAVSVAQKSSGWMWSVSIAFVSSDGLTFNQMPSIVSASCIQTEHRIEMLNFSVSHRYLSKKLFFHSFAINVWSIFLSCILVQLLCTANISHIAHGSLRFSNHYLYKQILAVSLNDLIYDPHDGIH